MWITTKLFTQFDCKLSPRTRDSALSYFNESTWMISFTDYLEDNDYQLVSIATHVREKDIGKGPRAVKQI